MGWKIYKSNFVFAIDLDNGTYKATATKIEKEPFISVAGKLTAELNTAGKNPLPASSNLNTPKKNSPTKLKAIPATAPNTAY